MSVLPVPALMVLVLLSGPLRLLRLAFVGRAALLVVLGLSFNFVLPIRASLDPVINEGDPTCESWGGAAAAVYANALPGGLAERLPLCQPLADGLSRVQYQTPPITQRNAPLRAQLEMYWQYFDWQWSRGMDPIEVPGTARLPFTLLFLALGVVGLWAAWRSGGAIFAYLAVLTGTLTLALVVYLNFKHGFSLSPEIPDRALHEVRERDYFFVAGFLVWGCLAGIGLAWFWHTLSGVARGPRRYTVVSPILAIALFPMMLNWSWASRAGDYAARSWAYDLLMSVEPYAVLLHERRQRHVSPLVPPRGRGHPKGRHGHRWPVPLHDMVSEAARGADAPGTSATIRSIARARALRGAAASRVLDHHT